MGAWKIIVDIVISLIIAILVFLGVKKGIVKSFFKTSKIFFVILVTILIGSFVTSLCQNLFLNDMFEEGLINKAFSNIIGYLLAFAVSYILVTIAIAILERVCEISIIGWINHFAGILSGLANAYIICSVVVYIIELSLGVEFIEGTFLARLIHRIGLFTF